MCLDSLGVGSHLAGIPAPVNVSKLIVMGSILGCREAGLIIAAGMSVGRSPLMKVMENRWKKNDLTAEDERNDSVLENRRAISKVRESRYQNQI